MEKSASNISIGSVSGSETSDHGYVPKEESRGDDWQKFGLDGKSELEGSQVALAKSEEDKKDEVAVDLGNAEGGQNKEEEDKPSKHPFVDLSPDSTGEFGYTKTQLNFMHRRKNMVNIQKMGGIDDIAKHLHTDYEKGVGTDTLEQRLHAFGSNKLKQKGARSIILHYVDALKDFTLLILIVAGVVSMGLALAYPPIWTEDNDKLGWIEGAAILLAVAIVSSVGAVQNWLKDRKFRKLNSVKNDRRVNMLRDGNTVQVSIYDIVVGDVVLLSEGNQVPADGLCVESENLETDESVMTGETDQIKHSPQAPFMLSGCQVAQGIGKMLVTNVGESSEWGATMKKLGEAANQETPLQKKLDDLAIFIGKIGVTAAVFTFIALCGIWIYEEYNINLMPGGFDVIHLTRLLDAFIIAITIIVVAIPEGLPLAVTISLAYSMQKMLKDNNLVRHLAACETMGGVTTICSDKTGTLTLNQMTVVKGYFAGRYYEGIPDTDELPGEYVKILTEGIGLNSTAFINKAKEDPDKKKKKDKFASLKVKDELVGNKTECALILLSQKFGTSYEDVRAATKRAKMYPFSSQRKRMSTLIEIEDDDGKDMYRVYTKGASEIVLDLCNTILDDEGNRVPLTDGIREEMKGHIEDMASQTLRTLVLAFNDFPREGFTDEMLQEAPETDLCMCALVGIHDPLREEVKDAVKTCQAAGIVIRMVTGDNVNTAKAIAKECGIYTEGGKVIEGRSFSDMRVSQQDELIKDLQVMARSSPTDKYKLVKRLRMSGEVVAVTGDGTNDAPALKEADIGLSMGISGTEVAKEASDVVIMDDNFNSIKLAVMWGRCVYDNIRKFVQFQTTVNVVALVVAFVGAITGKGTPLTAVQLLWVNLIMDSMGALALGTEPPTESLLQRKPYGRTEPLISTRMWRNILLTALYQLVVLFVILYAGCYIFFLEGTGKCGDDTPLGKRSVHYSILFTAFVFMQVGNEICSRKVNNERNVFAGMHKNPMFIFIITVTVFVQILIVHFGGELTATLPLWDGDFFEYKEISAFYKFYEIPIDIVINFQDQPFWDWKFWVNKGWLMWLLVVVVGILIVPFGIIVRMIPIDWYQGFKISKNARKVSIGVQTEETDLDDDSETKEVVTAAVVQLRKEKMEEEARQEMIDEKKKRELWSKQASRILGVNVSFRNPKSAEMQDLLDNEDKDDNSSFFSNE